MEPKIEKLRECIAGMRSIGMGKLEILVANLSVLDRILVEAGLKPPRESSGLDFDGVPVVVNYDLPPGTYLVREAMSSGDE